MDNSIVMSDLIYTYKPNKQLYAIVFFLFVYSICAISVFAQTADGHLAEARKTYILDDERESYSHFLSAIEIFEQNNKMREVVETWNTMGFWWSYWSKADSAETFYNRAEKLLERYDFPDLKTLNTYRQGVFYRKQFRLAEARSKLRKAQRLAEARQDSNYQAAAMNSLGIIMKDIGRLNDAQALIDSAITIARAQGYYEDLDTYLGNLAGVYSSMGDFSSALNCYVEAEKLGVDINTRLAIVRYGNIGVRYKQLNQPDQALFYFQKAYEIAQGARYPKHIVSRGLSLAETYLRIGNQERAAEILNDLRPVKDEFKLDRYNAKIAVLQSQVELASGRQEQAISTIKNVKEKYPESSFLRYELARNYYNLGQSWLAYETLKEEEWSPSPLFSIKKNIDQLLLHIRVQADLDPEQAYKTATDASAYLEKLQNRAIGSSLTNASYLIPFRSIYRQISILAWKRDRPVDEVYQWMQLAKGIVFEMERQEHDISSPKVDSLRFVRFQLEESLKNILVDESDLETEQEQTREEQIQGLSLRLDAINSLIRNSVSDSEKGMRTLSELRAELDDQTQIIDYLITDEGVLRFSITRENAEITFTAINKADLKTRVKRYNDLVRDPGESVIGNQLHSVLSQLLLPETLKEQIVISPDAILHYVPFETLRERDSFLIERHSVSYILSSRYHSSSSNEVTFGKNERLLMVSNPVIRPIPNSLISIPTPSLPFASLEADSIRSYFDSVTELSRENATRLNVSKALKDTFDVLHFASHGVISDESPLLSGILLADEQPHKQLFSVSDINRIPIKTKMVMLSSCNSASGTLVDGEGFLGLQRSFLSKKIPYVGASLWSVNDASTAMLMNRFYKHLFPEEKSGFWSWFLGGEDQQSPAKAMQMAKRSLMQQKKYRHPYYWAPFIVIKGI